MKKITLNTTKPIINENPLEIENNLLKMPSEDLASKSRKDHQSIVKTLDNQDNGLCLVVLGGISAIVSFLFFFLSFKRARNKMQGIDTRSLQFFVFIICAVLAVTLLAVGLYIVLTNLKLRNAYKKEISTIASVRSNRENSK